MRTSNARIVRVREAPHHTGWRDELQTRVADWVRRLSGGSAGVRIENSCCSGPVTGTDSTILYVMRRRALAVQVDVDNTQREG